jgi:hypothetical protein
LLGHLARNIVKLALNTRIRTRVVVTVHPIFVFEKMKQFVAVDIISAIEIGVDKGGFTPISQVIQVFA